MRSNYKKLGGYIRTVDERNRDLSITNLQGVSITKEFVPSIANIIGTDLSTYKIVRTGQFAYGPVTSRNGDKVSIALLKGDDCIISSSYVPFEVYRPDELLPEYLMLWFMRPEFDRYARFMSNGSAREVFDWDCMCGVELPIPPIEEQRKIVHDYQVITDRVELLVKMNNILLSLIQSERKYWLEDYGPFGGNRPDDWKEVQLIDVANIVTGYSYSSDELSESTDISMATIKNFELGGGFRISGYKGLSPKKAVKPEQYCELFDTVVAHTDLTQGKIIGSAESILSFGDSSSVLISMDLVKVTPKVKGISKYLITAILQDNMFKNHCLQFINGTTVMHLSKEALRQYKLFLPKDFTCFEILNSALESYYKLISINLNEIEVLNKIKPFVMR